MLGAVCQAACAVMGQFAGNPGLTSLYRKDFVFFRIPAY
jgi:hypothetical protein